MAAKRRQHLTLNRFAHDKSKCVQVDIPDGDAGRLVVQEATQILGQWIPLMERGLWVDPTACNGVSQVAVFNRQLNEVMRRLRATAGELNAEMKILAHMRRDIAICLEQLDSALVYRHENVLIQRPRYSIDQYAEQDLLLKDRDTKHQICSDRQLELSRVLKLQFLKVKQMQLDIGELRNKIHQEITRLKNIQDAILPYRSSYRKKRMAVETEQLRRKVEKVDQMIGQGIMPYPNKYPIKGVVLDAHLPVHKRGERVKELHPFAAEENSRKPTRVFALATKDVFKAMTVMAGASMCAAGKAIKESHIMRTQVTNLTNVTLGVKPFDVTHRKMRVMFGRLKVGYEYGCGADARRGTVDIDKIFAPPEGYSKRSKPIKQLV